MCGRLANVFRCVFFTSAFHFAWSSAPDVCCTYVCMFASTYVRKSLWTFLHVFVLNLLFIVGRQPVGVGRCTGRIWFCTGFTAFWWKHARRAFHDRMFIYEIDVSSSVVCSRVVRFLQQQIHNNKKNRKRTEIF